MLDELCSIEVRDVSKNVSAIFPAKFFKVCGSSEGFFFGDFAQGFFEKGECCLCVCVVADISCNHAAVVGHSPNGHSIQAHNFLSGCLEVSTVAITVAEVSFFVFELFESESFRLDLCSFSCVGGKFCAH